MREEGRQQGRKAGLREALRLILEHRFGPIPEEIAARLARLSADQLAKLETVALTVDSLTAFQALLPD